MVWLPFKRVFVVYHCWFDSKEPEPFQNLRTPVVLSIATLRANCSLPVTVLDLSEQERDWGDFPVKLNFKVERRRGYYYRVRERIKGWRHLSRLPDIHNWALKSDTSHIWYADTDTFWLKSPESRSDRFCFDGYNSGFYYYSPAKCNEFMKLFQAYAWAAIHSGSVRETLRKDCSYDASYGVWDEMVLGHMARENPEFFIHCGQHEHVTCDSLSRDLLPRAVLFHGNSSSLTNPFARRGCDVPHNRGILAIAIREIYQRLFLEHSDLERIFTQQELTYFLSRACFINGFGLKRGTYF